MIAPSVMVSWMTDEVKYEISRPNTTQKLPIIIHVCVPNFTAAALTTGAENLIV